MIDIRRAGVEDISELVELRVLLFYEMNVVPSRKNEQLLRESLESFFRTNIPSGEFLSWVAVSGKLIIASSGLVFLQKPPSPQNLTGREAYVMNMYTRKEWRNQGLAMKLLEKIHDFLKKQQVDLTSLHSTEVARPVYEKMGYSAMNNEMIHVLRPPSTTE
ncbi:MAG: GNAT family N-acetyltransferase [Candidatus Heimdallarchaeota archaeon]